MKQPNHFVFSVAAVVSLVVSPACVGVIDTDVSEEEVDSLAGPGPSGLEWVKYFHDRPPSQSIHVAEVDLCAPNLEVRATGPSDGYKRVSTFAAHTGAIVAINGGHTFPDQANLPGPTAHDGQFFGLPDRGDIGQAVFGDGLATLVDQSNSYSPEPSHQEVISGPLTLVHDGAVHPYVAQASHTPTCDVHPRTLLGLTADRRKLIMVVVDGRNASAGRRGMTCNEAAQYMIGRGARWALNLDGGGSSEMVVAGNIVNRPSDGSERVLGSHLGIVRTPGARGHCASPPAQPPSAAACGNLVPGESLTPGQSVSSCDGRVSLVHQTDGNLVLYGPSGTALWHTHTYGDATSVFKMQHDGNAVLGGPFGALWSTDTWGTSNAYLSIQNDGNLVMYSGSYVLWASGTQVLPTQPEAPTPEAPTPTPEPSGCGLLASGAALGRSEAVVSCDGRFTLAHQDDGNVVLYHFITPIWSSGTSGQTTDTLVMQGDGNLVLYGGGSPKWHTGTNGQPGARLALQDDGNVVLYKGGFPLWATDTCCR